MVDARASTDFPIYQYDDLPSSRSIRLLKFISHVPGSRIFEGNLHIFDLDVTDLPHYVAISYAWKTPDIKAAELIERPENPCISMKGQQIPISETLFDLFDHSWKNSEEEEFLWIDAICINQENIAERNSQVELMQDIYEGARLVCIWLGLHDDNSRISIPIIESFVNAKEDIEAPKQMVVPIQPFTTPQHYEAIGLPFVSAEEWKAVTNFFMRGWFHRVWTVQEVVLATDAVVVCGDSAIAWEEVALFTAIITFTGLSAKLYFERPDSSTNKQTMFGSDDVAMMKGVYGAQIDMDATSDSIAEWFAHVFQFTDDDGFIAAKLAWLLQLSRRRSLSDARDRVYAMKTLAVKYHKPYDWQRLRSDYLKSEETVFTDTTYYILEKLRNLSFLSFVEDKTDQENSRLPSWVPDFSQRGSPWPLVLYAVYDCWHGSSNNVNFETPAWMVVQEGNTLLTRGIRLASLQAVSKSCEFAVVSSRLSSLLEFTMTLHDFPLQDESRGEALMKTLAAGTGHSSASIWSRGGNGSFAALLEPFRLFLLLQISVEIHNWMAGTNRLYSTWWDERQQLEVLCNAETYLPSRSDFDDYFANFSTLRAKNSLSRNTPLTDDPNMFEQLFKPQSAYSDLVRLPLAGRRLLRTTKHNIGLAPAAARAEDEIWLLHGSKVPFVLRRRPDASFAFLGEAYLHGFMHGEAFETHPDLFAQVQEVALR